MSDCKFEELENGASFEVYGDVHINYDYPKICTCIKDSDDTAHEIHGCSFFMNPNDVVFAI